MNKKIIVSIFFIALFAVVLGIVEFVSLKNQTTSVSVIPPPPVAPTISPMPAKFDLGSCASIAPSAIADTISQQTNGFSQDSYIQTSTVAGWSFIFVSDARYCLLYPSDWQVRVAGAYGNNLMFNESIATGTRQALFVQVVGASLPLEQADKATYSAGGEGAEGQIPIVDPTEKVLQRQIETVGDKTTLFESTEKNGTTINRYFVGGMVFQSTVSSEFAGSKDYASFLSALKQVVSSTQFIQ